MIPKFKSARELLTEIYPATLELLAKRVRAEAFEMVMDGIGKLPYDVSYGMKSFPSDALVGMIAALAAEAAR